MVHGALFKERVSPSKKGQKRLTNVKESFSQDPAQCDNNFSNPLTAEPFKKRMKLPIRRPNESLNHLSEDDDFEEETLAVRRDRLKQKEFQSMNAEKLPKPALKPRKMKEKVANAPVLKPVDAEIRRCKGKAKVTETEDLSSDSCNDNYAKKNNAKGKAKMVDEHIQILSDSDDGSLPSIKWRGHMEKFVDALRGLSDYKRGLLEEAGFGSLFNLTAFEMLEFLCRYLVEQYNPMKGQINLADGYVLELSKKDVEICLGIPRGKVKVVKIDSSIKIQVVKDWHAHHDKAKHDIRYDILMNISDFLKQEHSFSYLFMCFSWIPPYIINMIIYIISDVHEDKYGDVVKKLVDPKNDGTNFLIDFVVLIHSCIVEPTQSGACNQTLVRSLEGITLGDLKKMNWCGFVIKTLVDAKLRWLKNRDAPFTGCLPFLTVLYLDRVVLFNQRAIPRKNPAFIGWTQRLITERENIEIQYGSFGCGKVKAQQQINRLEKKQP